MRDFDEGLLKVLPTGELVKLVQLVGLLGSPGYGKVGDFLD
jgi:hypothetical protein